MKSKTLQDLPIEKVYWKIGEVAEMYNVSPSLLRFWETEFPELKPNKTVRGERLYNKKQLAIVNRIYTLVKVEQYTLKGARRQLTLNPI